MTDTLEVIRARAVDHERELSEKHYLSIKDVASMVGLSQTFIRDVPRDELPFTEFGHGLKLKRRRYRKVDVEGWLEREHVRQNTPRRRGAA